MFLDGCTSIRDRSAIRHLGEVLVIKKRFSDCRWTASRVPSLIGSTLEDARNLVSEMTEADAAHLCRFFVDTLPLAIQVDWTDVLRVFSACNFFKGLSKQAHVVVQDCSTVRNYGLLEGKRCALEWVWSV